MITNVALEVTTSFPVFIHAYVNRVLRRIFGLKKYEVAGECRKLCNEELS
jgi:hypothetical protein